MISILKKPSAWLPIAMSFMALVMLVSYIFLFTPNGIVREKDEGVAAHLFQLLMGGQLPIIAFFLFKYLASATKQVLSILALQIMAMLLAMAPVFILNL